MLTKKQTALWRKWIKALKSGKYKQTKRVLKDSKGYCCLGVACDISKEGKWKSYDSENVYFVGVNDENDTLLPLAVRDALGLEYTFGFTTSLLRSSNMPYTISEVNDNVRSRKGPFSNVLPHIEKYFEEHKYKAPKKGKK